MAIAVRATEVSQWGCPHCGYPKHMPTPTTYISMKVFICECRKCGETFCEIFKDLQEFDFVWKDKHFKMQTHPRKGIPKGEAILKYARGSFGQRAECSRMQPN